MTGCFIRMESEEWRFFLSQVEGAAQVIVPLCYPSINSPLLVGLRRSDLEALQSNGLVLQVMTRAIIATDCETMQFLNVCNYYWFDTIVYVLYFDG